MRAILPKRSLALLVGLSLVVAACVTKGTEHGTLHRWWSGLGPVIPHDTFPGDCKLCHIGEGWDTLRTGFEFDHQARTGVRLEGAHARARCLRCHNDRGPVSVFTARGCVGCHEDFHHGELGSTCTNCHTQETWRAGGQLEMHNRTRFPLTGAHTLVACQRCHPGALVGRFVPTPIDCVACHYQDMIATTNPNHVALGLVNRCERCHLPTQWEQTAQ